MSLNMTVSPDFSPDKLPGWYIFNTWLQKKLDVAIHLTMYDTFEEQRQAINEGKVDLIYANPSDAAALVRQHGFVATVHPTGLADEAVVVVSAAAPAQKVEDLQAGVKIATTADPDVNMLGMIMLEPADLTPQNVQTDVYGNYTLVAKQIMNGNAQVGILPARAYDALSSMVRNSLRPLVRSEISVIRHMLLAGKNAAGIVPALCEVLLAMAQDEKGGPILKDIGFAGWDKTSHEDVEFMIDLVDTLVA